MLTFLRCPPSDRALVRTTAPIERALRDIRARKDATVYFPNAANCDRVIYGVVSQQDEEKVSRRSATPPAGIAGPPSMAA